MTIYIAKVQNGIVTQVIAGCVNWPSEKLDSTWIDVTDLKICIGDGGGNKAIAFSDAGGSGIIAIAYPLKN